MTLAFRVRDLNKGVPLIDELRCSARFLHVDASTTADQLTLTADADLQKLAEPLGQFIDLKAVKLAGKANGEMQVRRLAKDQFQVQGNAQLRQLDLTWKTTAPWQEEVVTAQFAAVGRIGPKGEQRIDSGAVTINLGNDVVTAKLTEPIVDIDGGPWGTLDVRVAGELARWHKRARSWTTSLDDWHPTGQANVQMQVRPSPGAIECTMANFEAKEFRCTGPNLWLQEPTLNVQTIGRWDAKTGDLELTRTRLTCAAIAVDADKLSLQPATRTLRGTVNLTGDLARLRQWTHDPRTKPEKPLQGYLAGRVDVHTTKDRLAANFNFTLKDVLYGATANPTWREPEVKCVGRGVYDVARDVFQLEKIKLGNATFNADARGKIANVTTSKRSSRNFDRCWARTSRSPARTSALSRSRGRLVRKASRAWWRSRSRGHLLRRQR